MKAKRQALIREIVESQNIQTQEELAEALGKRGMVVTQATVSRDIKEMHLIKVLAEDGTYRYATIDQNDQGMGDRLIRMLADSVIDLNSANNLIVIRPCRQRPCRGRGGGQPALAGGAGNHRRR